MRVSEPLSSNSYSSISDTFFSNGARVGDPLQLVLILFVFSDPVFLMVRELEILFS